MTDETHIRALFDITGGIEDRYLAEAAAAADRSRRRLRTLTRSAAVLILLIGAAVFWNHGQPQDPSVPFFAIRVHAADGTTATLEAVGDRTPLSSGVDVAFPGKETYTLDISLGDYTGDPADFAEGEFSLFHKGAYLAPGDSDDSLAVAWITLEDGFRGYRITGWCDTFDYIDITIRDENGKILHQKSLSITWENGYQVNVRSSYTYQEGLTTDELIDQVLSQDYFFTTVMASSDSTAYSFLRNGHGCFAELEERPGTAEKLLERYVRIMNGEQIYPANESGISSDWIVGLMLSRDVYRNQLTQQEQELFASFGAWVVRDSSGGETLPGGPGGD